MARHIGPWRTVLLFMAILMPCLGLSALHTWLVGKTGWPKAYGFTCQGRSCEFEDLYYSPRLLVHHTGYEIGLFALVWLFPVAFVTSIAIILLRRRLASRRSRIHPIDD